MPSTGKKNAGRRPGLSSLTYKRLVEMAEENFATRRRRRGGATEGSAILYGLALKAADKAVGDVFSDREESLKLRATRARLIVAGLSNSNFDDPSFRRKFTNVLVNNLPFATEDVLVKMIVERLRYSLENGPLW